MIQVCVNCRVTYGKFSYFTGGEWYWVRKTATLDEIETAVTRRWQVTKADDTLRVDHLRVQSERTDVTPPNNQVPIA